MERVHCAPGRGAAASAAVAAVAQRYAYKGARKWIAPRLKGSRVTA